MEEMNTTDSAAILESIHQGGLAKRGIHPQPGRLSRALGEGTGGDGSFQGCLLLGGVSVLKSVSLATSPEENFVVRVTSPLRRAAQGGRPLGHLPCLLPIPHPCGRLFSNKVCLSFSFSPALFLSHLEVGSNDLFFKRKGKI